MSLLRSLIAAVLCVGFAAAAQAAPAGPQKMAIKEEKKQYVLDVSYPRFGFAPIDRQIEAWAQDLAREFRETAKESAGEPQPWSAEISYEVPRNDAVMATVLFTYYSYTGGAHPNSTFETFNFFKSDGMKADLAEIFTLRGIQRISDISIARLKQDLGGPDGMSDMDWIKKGAGPNARNFAAYVLMPGELVIYFDPYQVAAYAAGPQEVHIPLSRLKDVMRPDPRVPAASFECANARSDVERAICSSRDLARLDRRLGEAYANKMVWAVDEAHAKALREQQRAWLRTRDACRGPWMGKCLTQVYEKRIKQLESFAE
ncbi:MAG: DUF3298 domain-containing protein [Alphaproteobacteria bacterium]|nr:DUF3298 domain-containing protein [Alphaproteobacteria bacterium]